ncbi:MAG: FAD-binding protein [Rhodobacteraceae bacterium]|nr:FAD-binding protein [Paracoccaceae bacterium]
MSIESAKVRLEKMLGSRFRVTRGELVQHGQNESIFPVTPPDAVVYPTNTKEVAGIVTICSEEACPIIAWGVGTSLEGHALAFQGGVTVDMSMMNKVLELNAEDFNVVVQPGITRKQLEHELRASGLFFPIDPGADATLGGMAATRASGTTAVRYGTLRDNVLALEVVLADGRIIRTGSRARKSSAGYDLTALFVGSEGTLGIMTELTLKLYGQPEAVAAATCSFENVASCVDAVTEIIQMGLPVARLELLDSAMMRGINQWDRSLNMTEQPHLFMEFHGSEASVHEHAEIAGEIVSDHGGSEFSWATRTEDRSRLWKARHDAYYAAKAMRPNCMVLTTDACVPISRLAEAINETVADIEASPLEGPIVGHVGDGNFHIALLLDPESEDEIAAAKTIQANINHRALRLGGTITGEHGVGIGKMRYMAKEHGDAWKVMSAIKRALDPKNVLNPGKVVQLN